jgi:hypothetical protein
MPCLAHGGRKGMTMKSEGLVLLASTLGLVLAPACSASSGDFSPPAEAGAGGSSSGAVSGSGGKGAPTEQQILCLGNFYCTPGTVCCADMMQNAACSTGPTCPFGRFQLCMADSDCGGRTCSPITVTGITAGLCPLGGGSSSSGGGGSSSSSGGSSSGGADGDAGDAGGDALGDGSSGSGSDAPTE